MKSGMPGPRQSLYGLVKKLALVVVPIALLGEAGHQLFEHLHKEAAHHAFHLLFGGGALVVFGIYLVREIRTNGWPSFSWRLRPSESLEEGPRGLPKERKAA